MLIFVKTIGKVGVRAFQWKLKPVAIMDKAIVFNQSRNKDHLC
jgi:hypothetical protein